MSFTSFFGWCLLAGVVAVFIQLYLTSKKKSAYMAALKAGSTKAECITKGRSYYGSMSKAQRKKKWYR